MRESDVMPDVYIPNVGFRQARLRLEHPVSTERDGRTLTIMELVSTEKGTDLLYEFSCVPEERTNPDVLGRSYERVVLRDGERDTAATRNAFGSSSTAARNNWATRRRIGLLPTPAWIFAMSRYGYPARSSETGPLFLELVPFAADPEHEQLALDASDTREGITITVRGIDASASGTAVNIEATIDPPVMRPLSIGGMSGMRDGITALTLRDDKGRVYPEVHGPKTGVPIRRGAPTSRSLSRSLPTRTSSSWRSRSYSSTTTLARSSSIFPSRFRSKRRSIAVRSASSRPRRPSAPNPGTAGPPWACRSTWEAGTAIGAC